MRASACENCLLSLGPCKQTRGNSKQDMTIYSAWSQTQGGR